MHAVSLFGIAATSWWALVLAVRIAAVVATFVQPAFRRRAAKRDDQPPVSIVIPVSRLEPDAEAAFASVFSQSYPQFEVLITSAENDSAAITMARASAARFPEVPAQFLLGNERFTLNPKISNVAPAIEAARHDLILIKDSNIRIGAGQLAEFVRNLTPGTGMVCAVPIATRPANFCAEIECAMMNAHAAPLLMAASVLQLNIGFGKVMLIDRRDLHRVGGIDITANTFGDDHVLAKALARVGLRTVFSAGVIHQVLGRRSLREVWDRQLRWMVIRRDEEPLAFLAEPFFGGGFATLAGAAAAATLGISAWAVAAATLVLWLASDALVVAGRHWGWSWRLPLAGVCRELLIPGLWARAWSTRKVNWAGRPFELSQPAQDRL
jgi:ceramide glucosyltransferase